ncbi:MAG: DUF2442 domain-containing protein [Longimicrobiales bacterium]
MKSVKRGSPTSDVELSNVSQHGLWLLVDGSEHFLPFDDFPWFRQASIGQLATIERPTQRHLYWPELDVDLSLESLEHPERYPLVSRGRRSRDEGS